MMSCSVLTGLTINQQTLLPVNTNQSTLYHITEDLRLHQQCCENLRSHVAGHYFQTPLSALITLLSTQNKTPSRIFLAVDI
jgi:hypothetical protein